MSAPLSTSSSEAEGPSPTIRTPATAGSSSLTNRAGKVPTKDKEEARASRRRQKKEGTLDDKQQQKKKRRSSISCSTAPKKADGLLAGLLAIGIYALMHESGIMTILLLAFVWWYSLEESHQRIFLFFLVVLNFAEYFYLLPPVLARYQQEDWWDVPTIKKAVLTMSIFWTIAWFSAATGSYLDNKEQKQKLEREKRRLEREAHFLKHEEEQRQKQSAPASGDAH